MGVSHVISNHLGLLVLNEELRYLFDRYGS